MATWGDQDSMGGIVGLTGFGGRVLWGAWGGSGQVLDSLHFQLDGAGNPNGSVRVALVHNSVDDPEGADVVFEATHDVAGAGAYQVDASQETIPDGGWLGICGKTDEGDINLNGSNSGGGTNDIDTLYDGGDDNDPDGPWDDPLTSGWNEVTGGRARVWITHSAAAAATTHGPLAGQRGHARASRRGMGRGAAFEKIKGIWQKPTRILVPVGLDLRGA